MSVAAPKVVPRTGGEQYRKRPQRNIHDFARVPVPVYRHAAPSAPWPWMDFDIDASDVQPLPTGLLGDPEWDRYPQSMFGNWTNEQVNRSQMLSKCSSLELSTVHKLSLSEDGRFDKEVESRAVRKDDAAGLRAHWNHLRIPPPSNIRVQALFVEDMTLPVLKMLGTKYNVEPFFFASSVNWIPSRYQEDPKALEDHITVVLPFIRALKNNNQPITRARPLRMQTFTSIKPQANGVVEGPLPYVEEQQKIDTQAPLSLPGKLDLLFGLDDTNPVVYEENKFLIQDILSLHMVRKTTTSTIISYHNGSQGTPAKRLQFLVQRTGDSVYWSKIFKRSKDPTFLFLSILWYALYAWDEAFEVLSRYINALEYNITQVNDVKATRELHRLQAHLSQYEQLLQDFLQSVEFVRDTPNPAMNSPSVSKVEREDSAKLLRTEANHLVSEIQKLTRQREVLTNRLANAIHLTFATVNMMDSKTMQGLAEVTVKDSAAIKQIAYLSMVFLPATYLANVFSMNVREINPPWLSHTKETLAHYIVSAVGLTLFTSWLVIALQRDSSFYPSDSGVLRRTLWPLYYAYGAVVSVKRWLGRRAAGRPSPFLNP